MQISKLFIALWDRYLSHIATVIGRMNILGIAFLFTVIVYFSYYKMGETELVESPLRLIYFIVTVSSTVGFGDYSPTTELGQIFTALFVIPVAIGLFAVVAAKFAAKAASIWYRKLKGMHEVTANKHIVIIGYNRDRTPLLVQQLIREESRKLVLVSIEQKENPLAGQVEFVNVPSFTNESELNRSSLTNASCIIVDTDSDENTLTIALFVAGINPNAHLVAHFEENIKGQLLKNHHPNAECISNLSTNLLAKSVIDSGSSLVHSELVSAAKGQTQYSIDVPAECAPFVMSEIFVPFKVQTEATIIGLRRVGSDNVTLNVKLDTQVNPGDTIFYISDERIQFTHWPENNTANKE